MTILNIIPQTEICMLLDYKLIDYSSFIKLASYFLFNLLAMYILIKTIYYNSTKRKDYLFTFFSISTVVYLLCFLLESVKLELGFALGLFAIFGIIRYRTDTIHIKEMTYLFIVIGLSVVNALAIQKVSLAELLFTNLAILFIVGYIEKRQLSREYTKEIKYEKIELVKPENYSKLLIDLEDRTGIKNISKVDILNINFLNDTADLIIYYPQ